jgi:hypothetical protein
MAQLRVARIGPEIDRQRAGLDTSTRPGRASGGATRLLVLLRLLAVLGCGRLLRHAGHGLRVLLAGLRGFLVGVVGPVLRGIAQGDLLGCGQPYYPTGAATSRARRPPSHEAARRRYPRGSTSGAPGRDQALGHSAPGTSGPLVSGAGCRRGPGTARRSPRGTRVRPLRTRRRETSSHRTSSGCRRSRS